MTCIILFVDGVDVVAKRRENAQKDMELRVVSQLISSIDELNAAGFTEGEAGGGGGGGGGQEGVFVVGATSRLEAIDPALRTGRRLGREIAMGIPDERARQKILEVSI